MANKTASRPPQGLRKPGSNAQALVAASLLGLHRKPVPCDPPVPPPPFFRQFFLPSFLADRSRVETFGPGYGTISGSDPDLLC